MRYHTMKNEILSSDIMEMEIYGRERSEHRKRIAAIKNLRRIEVGPFTTFYFENYDTMWMQVHEMLFVENGGKDQIQGELDAYNPLIPYGLELVATMMLEIGDPVRRSRELLKLGGVENTINITIGETVIDAVPVEPEQNRTTPDGKTSSVHFLKFSFDQLQIELFSQKEARALLSVTHPAYGHMAVMPEKTRIALSLIHI